MKQSHKAINRITAWQAKMLYKVLRKNDAGTLDPDREYPSSDLNISLDYLRLVLSYLAEEK